MSEYKYRIEMTHGQDTRIVDADLMVPHEGWMIFYQNEPQGGSKVEYWRARIECIVSIETQRPKP